MRRGKIGFLLFSILLLSSILAAGLSGQATKGDNLYRNLSLFTEVISLVERNYVDPVSENELIEGAFDGITDAIDEFSYYVPPEAIPFHETKNDSETKGVGLVVSKRLGYAYVIAVVEGSPAAQAGIDAGDFIERINGKFTTDLPVWQVRSLLLWGEGDTVELLIVRSDLDERETFSLTRTEYDDPPVTVEYVEDYALVGLPSFHEGTSEAFAAVLEEIGEKGIGKVVIDLRGNATSAYLEAIEAADHLIAKGTIASLEGKRVEKKVWEADPAVAYDGEIVLLIDSSTASGAEVFAAAVSGSESGRTVGTRTYGRAIEQKFVLLPSGGGLNITIAHYAGPGGDPIVEEGVRPDVAVNRAALALNAQNGSEEDLILEKGIEVLR